MDEITARSNEQFPLFAKYIEQFPDMVICVKYDLATLAVAARLPRNSPLLSPDVLALFRDAAYRLMGFADQGNFRDVSEYYYCIYEQMSERVA